jgi:hypothetical protein
MASRVFVAQYGGECAECGDRIHSGEEVRFNDDDELVHWVCDGQRSESVSAPCPKCFLVHTGDCF